MNEAVKKTVETNEEHIVQFLGIHDAEIKGLALIDLPKGQSLEISLKTEAGISFRLHLSGIASLKCNDFFTQNVIFRVFAITKADAAAELRNEKVNLSLSDQDISNFERGIKDGKLYLFQIDASVGCDISCICEKVEISS